jgi:hypothetical protein
VTTDVLVRNDLAALNFRGFQANLAARAMFRKLGLEDYLDQAMSWRMLRTLIVDFNDCDQGRFVGLVSQCDGVCSSGERLLLHAIATACDFAWLADYLSGLEEAQVPFKDRRVKRGRTWRRMDRVSGDHLRAVAACILAADEF